MSRARGADFSRQSFGTPAGNLPTHLRSSGARYGGPKGTRLVWGLCAYAGVNGSPGRCRQRGWWRCLGSLGGGSPTVC
jgi:hypothetical protein